MNLQAIFIFIIFLFASTVFAVCAPALLQKSELPREMPASAEMSFRENGGMLPTYKHIKVSGNLLSIEERAHRQETPRTLSFEISEAESAALYKAFVENKFDRIKNDEREAIVYDAPSEGVSIRANRKTYNISSGMNSPLSGSNKERYQNVKNAFLKIEAKYKTEEKQASDNYAVIEYDSNDHRWIFNSASAAELIKEDFAEIDLLVNRAAAEHNLKQSRKINDLSEYKFQYVAIFNKENEKEVWVNAFCSDFKMDWRKQIIAVDDGGSCFFNLKINLSKSTFYDLSVNGEA